MKSFFIIIIVIINFPHLGQLGTDSSGFHKSWCLMMELPNLTGTAHATEKLAKHEVAWIFQAN